MITIDKKRILAYEDIINYLINVIYIVIGQGFGGIS